MIKTTVQNCGYVDSIFLMNATKEMMEIDGINNAVLVMGTELNKSVLAEFGGLTDEAKAATPNELLVSLDINDDSLMAKAIEKLNDLVSGSDEKTEAEPEYRSLNKAADSLADANLAFISVPGEFAAQEADNALDRGMNVFIFSDNVPLEEEVALKKKALEKELFVMGPGCGVSIINNISLGLVSKVNKGSIGIVGASGSGIHEIAMLVTQYGLGISQAIGTGGRDLSEAVGGITMIQGIEYLEQDDETKVIVLVSKPPHPATMEKIFKRIKECSKPVVIFFLGGNPAAVKAAGACAPSTLEEAAEMAAKLARGEQIKEIDYIAGKKAALLDMAAAEKARLNPQQKYIRGLFCGGTHSEEAILMLQDMVPELHANVNFGKAVLLEDSKKSIGHSLVDMGDEEFTKGKPHPVMDPSILAGRLTEEASNPETAVILFDMLLGYGAHSDPIGTIEKTIAGLKEKAESEGRYLCMIASLCGTQLDPQDYDDQKKRMEALGIKVLPSNSQAAIVSGLIVS